MQIQFTTTTHTTAGKLAEALWDCSAADLAPDTARPDGKGGWLYAGTRLPIRRVHEDAPVLLVVVTHHDLAEPNRGTGSGFVQDGAGGWIADRFGSLGMRECARVVGRL